MTNFDRYYNNADGFCMAFNDILKDKVKGKINSEQKDKLIYDILKMLNDHPFVVNHPERAKEIAKFRINMISASNS